MEAMAKLKQSMLTGNIKEVEFYTRAELDKGILWSDILEQNLIPLMDKVGQDFSKGIAFLPELIAAGMAMSKAVAVIKESLGDIEIEPKAIIVLGTVFEDIHDIGKNIVKMSFEAAGFKVIDVGIDVQPEDFVKSCRENQADLIGISSLLSTTMLNLEATIARIRNEEPDVKIMGGGNPITPEFAKKIGADGYAPDGYIAVKKAEKLLGL